MSPRKYEGDSFGPHSRHLISLHRRKLCWWGNPGTISPSPRSLLLCHLPLLEMNYSDLLSLNKKSHKMSTLGKRELHGQVGAWGTSCPTPSLSPRAEGEVWPGPPVGTSQPISSLPFQHLWALHFLEPPFSFPLREPSLLSLRVKNASWDFCQY